MDMQNVSNLQIPDGVVRTIHDKDNRLLWGRLAYNTKYTGDTEQDGAPTPDAPVAIQVVTGEQTVNISDSVTSRDYVINLTGKNLFDKTMPIIANDYSTVSQIADGIRVTATGGGTFRYVRYLLFSTEDYIGKTITLSVNMQASASNKPRFSLGLCSVNGQNRLAKINLDSSGSASYVVEKDSSRPYFFLNVYSNTDGTVQSGDYVDYTNIQLEVGPATSYAPYYNYELCKIGGYQDYIYNSGDDWYVHKATGNVVLDGSDDEGWIVSSYDRIRTSSTFGLLYNSGSYGYYANQLINANSETVENSFNVGAAAIYIKCTSKTSSVANWKTWLSSNNLIIYASLVTPTDTQITDATLIGQLNAVHEWLTRYGYNATVAGNLPIIIDRTNL